MSFFDVTPVGRILNRFSSDVFAVDDTLPFILNIFLAQAFSLLGVVVVCCYGLPYIALLVAALAVVYYFIQVGSCPFHGVSARFTDVEAPFDTVLGALPLFSFFLCRSLLFRDAFCVIPAKHVTL